MRFTPLLCSCLATFSLNSCFSAWVSMTGKEQANPKTRDEAIAAYGQPVYAGKLAKNSSLQKGLQQDGILSGKDTITDWEVYEYHGLMQDQMAASSAATANATTLGASEAISLPVTLVKRAGSAAATHRFLAIYLHMPKIEAFEEMDGRWKIVVDGLKKESVGEKEKAPAISHRGH